MIKQCFLAIDIGVSNIKLGLYNFDGEVIDSLTVKCPGEYPRPGVFIQSSEKILSIIIDSIKSIIQKNNNLKVEAISFSGAMGGAMGVDNNWDVIADWSIVSDTRSYKYGKNMVDSYGSKILELSGTNFPSFVPKLLWWKNEYPAIYKKVSKFIFLSGFIASKMCDLLIEDAFVDYTYLQMSGIANIINKTWSKDICDYFNINMDLLPEIVSPLKIIGKLNKKVSQKCNLISGIPVVAGAGDKPIGALGAGITKPGMLIDEAASFSAFSLCVKEFIPDKSNKMLENIPSVINGQYLSSFFILGSGIAHEWFKNTFAKEEIEIAEKNNISPFKVLDEKCKDISPGSDKLLCFGHLGGRGYQVDSDTKGLWIGHTWNHKKEHFYKSLLESFAYEFGLVIKAMGKSHPDLKFKKVRVIGGGAKSDLWNQIKSDVTDLEYVQLNRNDLTLLGGVLIAGKAIGLYKDLDKTASKFTKPIKTYYPDKENNKIYEEYVKLYSQSLKQFRNTFKKLNKIS